MNNYPDDTFLARWLNNELSEEEKREFEASQDFAELERILGGVELLQGHEFASNALLDRVKLAIQAKQATTEKKTVRSFPVYLAIAAAIALFLLAYYFWPSSGNEMEFITGVGEVQVDQALPDGSTFSLNVDSKIQFHRGEWETERAIKLEGEAFFEVKKGGSFVVSSPQGQVKVLGTSFNVISRENLFEVSCFSGRVEVQPQEGAKEVLNPGMAFRFTPQDRLSTLRKVSEEEQEKSWQANVTWLIDRPINEIIEEFRRHYDLEVVMAGELLKKEGVFTTPIPHNNLKVALEATFDAIGVGVDTTDLGKGKLRLYQIK